jgi:hypothetical protein
MREVSKAESLICTYLRPVLASLPSHSAIDQSENFGKVLTGIEWFIPEVLEEIHSEWKGDDLDGIYPALANKNSDFEIEIIGLCIFIQDQTLTPLHLLLQLDPTENVISWFKCRLGESTGNGMRREPYSQGIVNGNKLQVLKRLNSINWVYHVEYGERRT